jgi:thioredoxin reductase (NADPH)
MANKSHYRVIILGSGAAGLTAAIYAARASLKPMLVQGIQPGGQLTITTDVENYPGFADVIQGPWLMEQMQKQAEHVGTQLFFASRRLISRRPLVLKFGRPLEATLIARPAPRRSAGTRVEAKLMGHGFSACATCDGFFKDKKLVVVGGGIQPWRRRHS